MERSLTALLPVRNAEATLLETVAEWLDVLPELTSRLELVIIDDCSSDATIEIADELDSEDRHETAFRGVLSIQNAREQLHWEPAFRSLRDGIGEYIERYRAFLGVGAG